MDELFAAVDISGLASNTQTVMIAFIGVGLGFVAFRYIQKVMGWRR